MKSITIRQLHEQTGRWVRRAAALGELHVTDRSRPVARLVPATVAVATPFFSRRKLPPAFRATQATGRGDSTAGISAERDER